MSQTSTGRSVFELAGVSFSYDGNAPALSGISFTLSAGEQVAVLGANASGKSTLLQLLDGLRFPTAGSIYAFGTLLSERAVECLPFAREFRRQVALLFQNADVQLFNATVRDELAFGPLQLRLSANEVSQRVEDMLELAGIVHLGERSPEELSGGEKKRVALASLLTSSPRVLLLDEPSAGLDPRTRSWLIALLSKLHRHGATLITATNDIALAEAVAERALVLGEDHRLLRDARIAEVLADKKLLAQANLITPRVEPAPNH